ncbi:sigma-70 family RNA polymerase sigma factor [Turicibacter sanguinis]|uniref:sigma-70 family RNA polymerase sigma factor n=1 Tax=Turicibacter sanguinis TaxID=154288 RepID=UPI0018AB4E2D|nr:sigma-70 family RNA polymerase sigma factor [Turicibacter sanguinis]MDB8559594.1 sigma-70 family RNA polymerase sigma factor [Turicibacter sanguinis]MDB8561047.1 sigma-70 family RNA polymerase sigma factor [Turicibacter sanguinis]
MEGSFECWYEEKLYLVYGAMKRLHIQGNTDEFYQIGLVALWEASLRYEEEKGEFDSFAYSYIINRMKTMLTGMTRYQERHCVTEDQLLDTYEGSSFGDQVMEELMMESYLRGVTPNQQEVVRERYVLNYSVEDVAKHLGISVNAVKNRTRDAMNKLRKSLKGDCKGYGI